jgi:hypothetical protein
LNEDAIKPWNYRSWVSPRDPDFRLKAQRVLDLYERKWHNQPLGPHDYVLCADEKTSIQARKRRHATPPAPGQTRRVESDYERRGALAYVAAWDVHRAKVFGICVPNTDWTFTRNCLISCLKTATCNKPLLENGGIRHRTYEPEY